ncbi:MAG: hypothetical protein A3J27_05175 [Candidatus Tectomicrobia bacterium RIFCSPLOWO2_12_FULL_69_37]|nr:MAG: hypothetical protein A3J27_05175 [Candidatus Tectomicrobia bacterium RIFCSPLOWO2_12_FULL_69_37]
MTPRRLRPGFCLLAVFLCFTATGPAGSAPRRERSAPQERQRRSELVEWNLISLSTRPDVRQGILVGRPGGEAKGAVLLFPGGNGAHSFRKRGGSFRLGNNFLVRTAPLFVQEGFVAAIVDAPSDHSSGMGDGFRTGEEHLADIQAAADHLAKKGIRRIFLIGTSRGTLSVASLSTKLKHPRVAGFVLTSSMDAISSLPLDEAASPVLVVHHAQDACRATTYSGAQAAYARLAKSARKHFITVSGGDTPVSGPCAPLHAHGFLGKERETVRAIAQWMRGEAAPGQINP